MSAADYFAHLAQGRFMIQRVRRSGEWVFPPRVAAPRSGHRDLEWASPSGHGTVVATTVMRARPPAPSWNVCLVQLAEGPRLMSRVEGLPPQDVRVGLAVVARIARDEEGQPVLVFDPDPR